MPNSKNDIILICTPLRFYTEIDEGLLFQWLEAIPCIQKIESISRELHLYITSRVISNDDLLNLMGVFDRYKFEAKQLEVFKNKDNQEWFDT